MLNEDLKNAKKFLENDDIKSGLFNIRNILEIIVKDACKIEGISLMKGGVRRDLFD